MPTTPPTEHPHTYSDFLLLSPATILTPTFSMSTRTAELLKSNAPILDVEKDSYRHIIKLSDALLRCIDDNVGQAGSALDVMKANRDTIAMHRSQAMTVTHPLRSLPAEMLKEIFHHATPSYHLQEYPIHDVISHSYPLWALSQVCAKWRGVALGDRTLWSFLSLTFDRYNTYKASTYTRRLALFLERSRSCLLNVSLNEGYLPVLEDYPHLLALLETCTHRWKNLDLVMCASSVQLFSGCAFDTLQRLNLQCKFDGDTDDDDEVDTFQNARALRTLTMDNRMPVAFDMPWSELQTVVVEGESYRDASNDVLDEFGNMTQLIELEMTLPWKRTLGEEWSTDLEPRVYNFPHLERLTLFEIGGDEADDEIDEEGVVLTLAEIFSRLEIPALKHLRISLSYRVSTFPDLGRASSLTSLDIHFHSDDAGILSTILAKTTNVEVLILRMDRMDSDSLDALMGGLTLKSGSEDTNILPRLSHLDMCHTSWRFSIDELLPCLESRIGRGIQTLVVTKGLPGPNPENMERWDRVHAAIAVIEQSAFTYASCYSH